MRVMFCQPSSAKAAISGPERQTVQVARALQQRGHQVIIAVILVDEAERVTDTTLATHAREHQVGVVSLYLPARYHLPRMVQRFADLVHQYDPDVVCTQGYKADVVAAAYGKVPTVALVPGWTAKDWKVRFFEWLDKQTLRRHSVVAIVSPAQKAEVLRYGVPPDRIFYLPTCMDIRALQPAYSCEQLTGILSRSLCGQTIGFVGRLSVEKGLTYLIDALKELRAKQADIRLLIVGEGEERANLQARVESLSLRQAVTFLGERGDARQIIGALDLLVLPSLTEGLPNVVLEAFAYKTPVVATAVGGVPELVIDTETGWLVPPRDPHALAQAILDALSNPEEARRRAENAYKHLLENFTVEKQVDKWEQALQAAVENWRKR
jgi:glycosyltransferase involved in cell wall biosynthesis